MKTFALLTIFIMTLGCKMQSNHVPLHEGLIHVSAENIAKVKIKIIEHSEIALNKYPLAVNVRLTGNNTGIYIDFPNGITTYDFVNLISWLDNSSNSDNNGHAKGWITSSTTKKTYYLHPEIENHRGDTLLGADDSGASIRIYLPEAAMSFTTEKTYYQQKPENPFIENKKFSTFEIFIDANPEFGNNNLITTHELDSKFGY
jgi:hypothetical protein